MCGIAGSLALDGRPMDAGRVVPMTASLLHRGPDAGGSWNDESIALGHRRLSILDLEGGDQPMVNEDGQVVVVFNGEIFNHHALRKKLAGKHRFKTRSDTEVLVHLWEEYGVSMLGQLEGFFALAIWDRRTKCLLLARDRLGQKPLFYADEGGYLDFASELRALATLPERCGEIDGASLDEVLALRRVRGSSSGYLGVKKIAPGEYLLAEEGRVSRGTYWQVPVHRPSAIGDEEALEEYRALFDGAVASRLEADVPLGLLLSGGLDSASVLESASRARAEAMRTFSVSFARDSESEADLARAVAEHLGAIHHEIPLDEADLVERAAGVLAEMDEPFADPSLLPTRLVAEAARREVTVCLSGDGGDELFAGYNHTARLLDDLRAVLSGDVRRPSALKRFSRHLRGMASSLPTPEPGVVGRDVGALWARASIRCPAEMRRFLRGPRLGDALDGPGLEEQIASELRAELPPSFKDEDPDLDSLLGAMLRHDARHNLPGMMLVKVDRASMAASLEVRSPFLDHRLVEWAARLPAHHKIAAGRRKVILRRALQGRVPAAILRAGKKGFGTPLARWFRGPLVPLAESLLLDSQLAAAGWLDGQALAAVLRAHRKRQRNLGELLWTLCALESWFRRSPG